MTVVAVAVVVAQAVPVAAAADPLPVVEVVGLPGVASQVAACRLAAAELYDATLTATTSRTPTGEVDFTWHASAHARVSSTDACVTGVMVETQLTDSTTVPNCPPVVRSDVRRSVSNDALTYQHSGATDYQVDNPVDFTVAYFGGPGTTQSTTGALVDRVQMSDGAGSDAGSASAARCYRLRSTVTEYDTAYYQNSQRQFVPFCTQQVSYEFVATPAGPERVGDPIVESITC